MFPGDRVYFFWNTTDPNSPWYFNDWGFSEGNYFLSPSNDIQIDFRSDAEYVANGFNFSIHSGNMIDHVCPQTHSMSYLEILLCNSEMMYKYYQVFLKDSTLLLSSNRLIYEYLSYELHPHLSEYLSKSFALLQIMLPSVSIVGKKCV